jgi:hypothetical protein
MQRQYQLSSESEIAKLARTGIAQQESVSLEQIRRSISLLTRSLGETWESESKEAAAGMLLVALANNSDLRQYLNDIGWRLVERFVTAHPEIASNISPRVVGDIFAYQHSSRTQAAVPC